jgi:hypothetical protein
MSEKIKYVKGVQRLTIGGKTVSDSKEIPIIKIVLKKGEIIEEEDR